MNWKQRLSSALKDVHATYSKPARLHGKSRKTATEFIGSIGGYYNHGQRWALEFNVKLYDVQLDVPGLYANNARHSFGYFAMCTNDGERGLLYNVFADAHRKCEKHLWERSVEDVWEQFRDHPTTFWGNNDVLDVSFSLAGRGGGHLVIDKFNGRNLQVSNPDLMSDLCEREPFSSYEVPDSYVMELFLLCIQLTVELDQKAIRRDVEYAAASHVWASLDEHDFKNLLAIYNRPTMLSDHLPDIREELLAVDGEDGTMCNTFDTVFLMAGIPPPAE